MFFAVFQNALPAYDTLRGIKGADPLVINDSLTLTADQLVKAKVHVEGMTEIFSKPLPMNLVIQIVMISAAALMIIFCKASPKKAVAGPVWQSGMVAVVAIYGIAWLADTYFSNYLDVIQVMLTDIVKEYPWSIAFVFFLVSVLINSQGAVVVSMLAPRLLAGY